MNKKQILLASAGGLLLVVLGVYFFAVPNMQVAAYKDTVSKKQSDLNDSLNKLSALLESDTLVKTDVETGTIHSDAKKGAELAKDVRAKLDLVKKDLTGFNSLPLLDFNGKYKTAQSLKNDEIAYISKTEAFVTEMEQTLIYMDKSADLTTKFSTFNMESLNSAESLPAMADGLDKIIQEFQTALDEFAKLTPTASLKEGHDYSIKTTGELMETLKQFSAAVRAGDLEKITAISEQVTAKQNDFTKKTEEYNAKFIRESELRKLDDALNQLDRDIGRKQASL